MTTRLAGGATVHLPPGGRRSALVWEAAVFVALLIAYNSVRALGGDDPVAAFDNARSVLMSQGGFAHEVEHLLNGWLSSVPVLAVAACYVYALTHYVLTPLVLVACRRRGGWVYWRGYWAIVVASAFALVVYALYPVAPPRLVPDLGIVDVMRDYASYGWWGDAASVPRGIGDATNQFAAMPSMHCGWATWCGIQMWQLGGRRWRNAAVSYPLTMALTVVATGNHYVLDVVAGVAAVVLAYLVVESLRRRHQRGHQGRNPRGRNPSVPARRTRHRARDYCAGGRQGHCSRRTRIPLVPGRLET